MAKKLKKQRKTKKMLKKISFLIAFFIFVLASVYFSVSLLKNPRFVLSDLQDKYSRVLGTATVNITLYVAGAPGKPVVTATPGCSSGSPYVQLSWNSTNDTDDYNIKRDSLALVSGLTGTSYQDTSVSGSTTYTYNVIAHGAMGNTSSDDVTATTGDCSSSTPITCTIVTFEDKNISSYSGTPKTEDRTPSFSGTTNTANANISIAITGKTSIVATTTANANGYWSWTEPSKLNYGTHLITITATDPSDPSNTASDSLTFRIKRADEDGEEDEKETVLVPFVPTKESPTPPSGKPVVEIPLEISIDIKNEGNKVFAGEDLMIDTIIKHYNKDSKEMEILYSVFDLNGNVIVSASDKITSSKNEIISKNIPIPKLTKPGKYTVTAKTKYNGFVITAENTFNICEKPILEFGGTIFTLSKIMQYISLIIILLIAFLIFFLILLLIEYYLSKKALFQITEDLLSKKGYFSRRKGVSR